MTELITKIAYSVLIAVIQLAAGSIISVPIYMVAIHINEKCNKRLITIVVLILVSSCIGLVLPLNIYGIFPIMLAVVAAGLPAAVALPILLSNSLFNMLVPYMDQMFVWRTAGYRIALAFLAGILGGLLLNLFQKSQTTLFKSSILQLYEREQIRWSKIATLIGNNISSAGTYLVIGVIVNELFNKYFLWSAIDYIISNSKMTLAAMYFAGLNVVNPIFIQTMNIVNMFMNLVLLSGLFVFLKLKGVVLYIGYYVIIATILGVSAYF